MNARGARSTCTRAALCANGNDILRETDLVLEWLRSPPREIAGLLSTNLGNKLVAFRRKLSGWASAA